MFRLSCIQTEYCSVSCETRCGCEANIKVMVLLIDCLWMPVTGKHSRLVNGRFWVIYPMVCCTVMSQVPPLSPLPRSLHYLRWRSWSMCTWCAMLRSSRIWLCSPFQPFREAWRSVTLPITTDLALDILPLILTLTIGGRQRYLTLDLWSAATSIYSGVKGVHWVGNTWHDPMVVLWQDKKSSIIKVVRSLFLSSDTDTYTAGAGDSSPAILQ